MTEIIRNSVVVTTRDLPSGVPKGTIGNVIRVPRVPGETAYTVMFDGHPPTYCALDDLERPHSVFTLRATTAQDLQSELLKQLARTADLQRRQADMATTQRAGAEYRACAKLCDEMIVFWRDIQIEPAE